jgi:hypothetical protein
MVKSPPLKDLEKYLYRIDGKCYKYRPYAVKCNHVLQKLPTSRRFEFSDTLGDRSFSDVALYRNAATRYLNVSPGLLDNMQL